MIRVIFSVVGALLSLFFIIAPLFLADQVGAAGVTAGIVIGGILFLLACVRRLPPNTVGIVRDPFDRVVGYCLGPIAVVWPGTRLAEQYDLGWRFLQLWEETFPTRERLAVLIGLKLAYIVDPRGMNWAWMQMLVDKLGSGSGQWQSYLNDLLRAELNEITTALTHETLVSPRGQAILKAWLPQKMMARTAGLGVQWVDIQVQAVKPAPSLAEVYAETFGGRAQNQVWGERAKIIAETLGGCAPWLADSLSRALLAASFMNQGQANVLIGLDGPAGRMGNGPHSAQGVWDVN